MTTTRLVLLALCTFAVCLTAVPARAGNFSWPYEDLSLCGEADISDSMFASTFIFSPNCLRLCKYAVGECKKVVRKVIACSLAFEKSRYSFGLKNCAEFPQNPTCRQNVIAAREEAKDLVLGLRDDELAACDAYGVTCAATCPQ